MKTNFYSAQSDFAAEGNHNLSSIMANLSDVADSSGKLVNNASLSPGAELQYFREALVSHLEFEKSMGNLTDDEMAIAQKLVNDFTEI
jgi:hypothetical protein